MKRALPNRIVFQWHITEQCNFRCRHCYQDSYAYQGLPSEQLASVLESLTEFVMACKAVHHRVSAHINITGGEPFLRSDLLQLIEKINETKLFSFAILSNGLLPDLDILARLKSLNPGFVQVSLEGKRSTNDKIRGKGSYDLVLRSLKEYNKFGIPTMISFTANADNYNEFPHVVKVARKYKAFKVWTDRYLPLNKDDKLLMSTEQFETLGDLINKEKNRKSLFRKRTTEVSSNRALQFLFSGGQPYKCSAGNTLLAILPNGDVLPCRRLPIKVGNVLTEKLTNIYTESNLLQKVISPEKKDDECLQCYYKESCSGGLKCLSFATKKDLSIKDINCMI